MKSKRIITLILLALIFVSFIMMLCNFIQTNIAYASEIETQIYQTSLRYDEEVRNFTNGDGGSLKNKGYFSVE